VVLLVSLVSVLLLVFMVVITVFGVIFMVSKATLHAMPTTMAGGDTTITAMMAMPMPMRAATTPIPTAAYRRMVVCY
jgi:hypothetical protein